MGKMRQSTQRNPLADKDLKNLKKSEKGPKKFGSGPRFHANLARSGESLKRKRRNITIRARSGE